MRSSFIGLVVAVTALAVGCGGSQLSMDASSDAPASDVAMDGTSGIDAPMDGAAHDAVVSETAPTDVPTVDVPPIDGATSDTMASDAPAGDVSTRDVPATDVPASDVPTGDASALIWQPHPGTSWQIQYSGTLDTTVDVAAYDIDLFDTPASTIDALQGAGRRVICYLSAGTVENWRPDASQFPQSAIGNPDTGWAGENWLDIRDATVRSIMQARFDLAVMKHCDAVDPDNVEGYSNNSGFPLTAADQLDFNRFLASEAHARGLAVGLKNDIDQVPDLVTDFDFTVNEQCFDYSECAALAPFIDANKPVFQLEYDITTMSADCPMANAMNFDTLYKNLSLDAYRVPCR